MSGLRRALIALAAVGFVAGAVPLALALANEGGHQRWLIAIFGPLTGWAFIGTGILVWLRRPSNRVGALMTAVGFSACLAALRVSDEPWIFITGLLFIALQWAVLYHLLLAFPGGRLRSNLERGLVVATYVSAAVIHPLQTVLFIDTAAMGLPENPLLIVGDPDVSADVGRFRYWLGLVLLAGLALVLVRRWRGAGGSQRRALAPVLITGGAVMALLGAWYVALLAGADEALIERLEEARIVVLATVPFAFWAGLVRSRVAGATALSQVVARLGDASGGRSGMSHALAAALEGTSIELAYPVPAGWYVDADGERVELPPAGSDRIVMPLERDGEPVAVVIHDATLEDQRELVRAVAAATQLALENERLGTELRAKVEELSASRARIVESSDAARRRLERDLHDGAQQRLVSLALRLRMLRSGLDGDSEAVRELESARGELDQALEELRELASGIHPSVLSDRGLDAAVLSLARRAPLPVELDGAAGGRLPEGVESAAYFVVAEALTNVAKYAKASHAHVNLRRDDGRIVVEVSDDGIGGADPGKGTGLSGLLDRVAALEGTLEVDSERGRGTTVRASIPCG